MNFSLEYTAQQEKFADEVRKWLEENVPRDLANPREPRKRSYEQWQKRRELARKLGEKGWLHPGCPREYGGGGLDADHSFVLYEELAERGISLPPYFDSAELAIAAVLVCGTADQKKRFLPPMLKGEAVTWQLFTEPEAGTDVANQQTNALRTVREGDYFIINGGKIFVGGLYAPPEQFLLLTRSDPKAPRHQNLSMFLAPANLQGVTILPLNLFPSGVVTGSTGRAVDAAPGIKHQVFFDDVRVHKSCLIGSEGEGWKVTNATLLVEHGEMGLRGGVARNMLGEKLLAQCRENPNVVNRLRENPQLLESVVSAYIGVQTERLFSMRNTWQAISGKHVPYTGPQLQLYSKLFVGLKLIKDIASVLGPCAFTDDSEWGLEEDIFEVCERCGLCIAPTGTPEALKIVISRTLGIGR